MARLNRGVASLVARTTKLVGVTTKGVRVGATHHRAKLTDADVDQIHALHEMGLSYKVIAEKFDDIPGGISYSTVRKIIKCQIRAQVPDRWRRR